jgi:SAM-dependent methyltransferase
VHGVEIDGSLARLARLRSRDCGFGDAVTVHHFERTDALPFDSGAFDVVICNAVLEHIHPRLRGTHLAEVWRVLKGGGYLFIFERPNRLWPIDGHTTGLPLVPYLPVGLARRYAVLFSRRVGRDDSVEDLIERGMRGVTYWEISRHLPGGRYIPNGDIDRYFGCARRFESPLRRSLKTVARVGYRLLEGTACRALRVPAAALLPGLSLCFRKE